MAAAVAITLVTPMYAPPVYAQPALTPQQRAIGNAISAGSPAARAAPVQQLKVSPGAQSGEVLENLATTAPRKVTSVTVGGISETAPLKQAEADGIVAPLVGPAVPTSDIEAARLSLLRRYRDAGYPLVTVSASLTTAGKLAYTVTEGRVAEVLLDGDIGPAGVKVLEFLQNLVKPGPVKADQLEKWLLLAQDVPGVALQTVLRPSESEPGALSLVARVSRSLISGYVSADNRAYRYSGPEQILGLVGFNSLTSLGERTELSIYKSLFNSTQIFGQAAFETFVGGSGAKVRLYAGAGDSRPEGTLRTSNYDGQTLVAGIQGSYPLIYTRQQKLNVLAIFDMIQSVVYQGNPTPASKDSLRVVRLGADYALQDIFAGDKRPAINQVSARLSKGLPFLGASTNGTGNLLGRAGSNPEFTKFSAELSRNQTIFAPWQDATVSLLGLVVGQWTPRDVIPSAEKFYLGGSRFTRGFYSGEVTGDNGLAATLEAQLNTGIAGEAFGYEYDFGMQFYGYYDWGQSWDNGTQAQNRRLASVGVGVRTALTSYLELDLEGVSRLTRSPQSPGGSIKPLVEKAFYWRLLSRF